MAQSHFEWDPTGWYSVSHRRERQKPENQILAYPRSQCLRQGTCSQAVQMMRNGQIPAVIESKAKGVYCWDKCGMGNKKESG